ncbi:hypothetical protein NCAS_0H03370 [Naumovozyma castellii]|uniref:Mitochondrial resolvase Ydc2 catalytic domain-containing protein n=1 Tax=Naumovozyma castellii TaxID=27288 RepID=G0VJG8_NAUCA|nr:hypothetical protein NCAS_0H03370 [Naumovozyma castellii CBS 4309]CCC71647.1 hypothetical protein NCAS_0H03370 [Naumovozyma castellii CBS 4309]
MSNILSLLNGYCNNVTAKTLKDLSLIIGSPIGITKLNRRTNIMEQCKHLEQLRLKRLHQGTLVINSIDTGISNFAISKFKWDLMSPWPTLLSWEKIQLERKFLPELEIESSSLEPNDFSLMTYRLVEYLLDEKDNVSKPDLFTIERQRTRTMSSRFVLDPIIRCNILENVLYSTLENRIRYNNMGKHEYSVLSSNPQRMTSFWCPTDNDKNKKKNSNKYSKDFKIKLVKEIIRNSCMDNANDLGRPFIGIPQDWKIDLVKLLNSSASAKFKLFNCLRNHENDTSNISGVKKDDDLADSFLHGLSWMEWLRNYIEIYNLLSRDTMQVSNKENATQFVEYCTMKREKMETLQSKIAA